MTFTYVCSYFLVAVLCASIELVVYFHVTFDMGSEREIRIFKTFILSFLVFCATNAVWVWINYGYLDFDGMGFSVVNLLSVCTSSYLWFMFIVVKTAAQRTDTLSFKVISALPLIVEAAIIISTPFTGLVFYYNNSGSYQHGPLYVVMVALAFFYLILASTQIYINARKTKSRLLREDYRALELFLFFPLVGGIIDVIVPNLPIMELVTTLGIIIIFTNLQSSRIYNDSLTGLNNRRRAETYLKGLMEYASPEEPVYFFIGDADKFKDINDKYGHIEGDRALKFIAQVLRRNVAGLLCNVARWGGDEFVIIAEGKTLDSPEELIERINDQLLKISEEELLPYTLHMSIGYTKCVSPDTRDLELLARADKMMYEKKHNIANSI